MENTDRPTSTPSSPYLSPPSTSSRKKPEFSGSFGDIFNELVSPSTPQTSTPPNGTTKLEAGLEISSSAKSGKGKGSPTPNMISSNGASAGSTAMNSNSNTTSSEEGEGSGRSRAGSSTFNGRDSGAGKRSSGR